MPKTTNDRLARLLDAPALARIVPHLPAETLHQLIEYRGLDGCGEIITSATTAQLTALFDLDLWRSPQPGRDEQFDARRFGEWLEMLVDIGEKVAARTVAALDKDLVIAGLSRYLRVFDPGTFEPTAPSDDEPIDRNELMHSEADGDRPECEVGGYLVRARRTDAWDAIVALLITLDSEHNHDFHALMQGCRRLSNSTPEIDGLDDLLLAPAQHLHDVAIERERRRSRHGYATPADARAFLQMARQPQTAEGPIGNNPIARAYFRETDIAMSDSVTSTDAVIARLLDADRVRQDFGGQSATPQGTRALLDALPPDNEAAGAPKLALLRRLMEFVLDHDETIYLTRGRELAFLANTLLAGCSVQSRPFSPQEAADAAACICNLGLERSSATDAFLVGHDLVTAFAVGWSALYRDVSLFVADHLVSTLADVRDGDVDTRRGFHRLRRTLMTQREAGTPWLARKAADVLAMLDMTAWISVLGLLDECPILPAALTAMLERRTTPVSPTAFEFISTTAQIGDIRVFVGMLPGVWSR